ncbi:uncharacterized protein PG998_012853 [Apiospora kogelbergensis]|uniref:uncharacterized protein n=1 Tax=Apiospora kogelbergensis TaxID=1337665 RepID=UPI0031316BB8
MEGNPIAFYDSKEILQSKNLRYVYYTMLILNRREFTRNILKVEINRDSKYWPALRAKPASIGYRKAYEPIKKVKDKLVEFLNTQGPLPQDAQIELFLGHSEGNFSVDRNLRQSRRTQEYLKEISADAKHMNFPRVKERELIHYPIAWKYEAVRLQARLKSSGWLIAVRFDARDDHMDEERYALKVLFTLHGKNGFRSLTHLVEDENNCITGFLCRNPSQGPLLDRLASAKQHGTVVDWTRRNRWCRQIIEGISALHGNGLKHGSLGRFLRNGLYIDDHDNVTFLNAFRHSFTYADDLQDLSIPPECRRPRGDDVAIPVEPATDIYQLGLILWCIAANEDAFYRSTVPRLDPDDEVGVAADTQLPMVDPSKAPPFMNRVVSMCRAARPEDRPPVRLLLEEFPPVSIGETETCRIRELSGVDETDDEPAAEDTMVAWPINIRCRRCHAPTADHYYHCGRCLVAVYYDICPACFAEGHHCLDDDHYLQELRSREPQGRYYSCLQEDGKRLPPLEC